MSDRHHIRSVKVTDSSTLSIHWADGHTSEFPGIWLAWACSCERCGNTESAVRHTLLTDLPDAPAITSVYCDDHNRLVINWDEEHISTFDPIWLRAHCLSETERQLRILKPRIWSSEIANQLPSMSYQRVADDADKHLEFLETLRDLGFVILRDVPTKRERTEEIAALVGKLRMTNYGIFELQSKPDPEIVGDTAIALNLHTDEPYRRDPPGITLFHVIQQSMDGGDSTLADGFNIARTLQSEDSDAFEILCTVHARFHRTLKEGRAFEIQAPIISRDQNGQVTGIRILDRGMAPVDTDADKVVTFYQALRKLLTLLYRGEGRITVKLEAGEMLVFNNQRILHGRHGFDPNQSVRHVRTCHVDLDEFHSRLRVAYLTRGREEAWMPLGSATNL